MAGQSKLGRGGGGRGRGRGCGNAQGDCNSGAMSLFNQRRRIEASLESGQSSSHRVPTQESGQSSPHHVPIESQSSRIQTVNPSPEAENGGLGSHDFKNTPLTSVLGARPGYVRGKGYGKKPPKKSQTQQANIEASLSSAMDTMRQEMQAEMDRKLQEERTKMEEELQKKLDDERQRLTGEVGQKVQEEVEKIFQEKLATLMTQMQQGHGF